MRFVTAAVMAIALVACTTTVGDWVFLGERTVTFKAEHDSILVTAGAGEFSRLKLLVGRAGVEILDVKVVYGNGRVQDIPVRAFIPAGGETRTLDLVGGERAVRSVELSYRSGRGRGRHALVQLWGRR